MPMTLTRLVLLLPLALAPVSGCAFLSKTFGGRSAAPAEPTPEQRRQSYIEDHPELDAEVRDAIAGGRLVEGMRGEEVKASLGHPVRYGVMLPSTPEQGDEEWIFEQVAFGTKTSLQSSGPRSERILSSVRDTRVRLWEGRVVGVDDLGVETRDELVGRCDHGASEACERLRRLDALAASEPAPAPAT